jgi:hypothetical protein
MSPETAQGLMDRWVTRDLLYAKRRHNQRFAPLTADEQTAIMSTRRLEALGLPRSERIEALRALASWHPPEEMV